MLDQVPPGKMSDFVDALLRAVPPKHMQPHSDIAPDPFDPNREETEEDRNRAGALRRLKALRGYKGKPGET